MLRPVKTRSGRAPSSEGSGSDLLQHERTAGLGESVQLWPEFVQCVGEREDRSVKRLKGFV